LAPNDGSAPFQRFSFVLRAVLPAKVGSLTIMSMDNLTGESHSSALINFRIAEQTEEIEGGERVEKLLTDVAATPDENPFICMDDEELPHTSMTEMPPAKKSTSRPAHTWTDARGIEKTYGSTLGLLTRKFVDIVQVSCTYVMHECQFSVLLAVHVINVEGPRLPVWIDFYKLS
jgi:hypothetical protein